MNNYHSFDVGHLKSKFWVIAVLNNPSRFKRRLELFHQFIAKMKKVGVKICVVEASYGDRNYETNDLDVELKVHLNTNTILWHKENLINLGISKLPKDWEYVAWIDADIDFVRHDWVEETIHQLQHHYVVQLFEDAIDLGPNNEIIKTSKSFMYCYKNHVEKMYQKVSNNYYNTVIVNGGVYWHPGYAWACTRKAIDTFGGLFEVCIAGSGDHHMACALIGQAKTSLPKGISDDYRNHLMNWETRALRLHRNVGYVKGTVYHFFHGKKANRKYRERWQILIENDYQPTRDLYKDWQGLITFYEGNYKLRDELQEYFQQRNEDSIDV
jgi:hypothetical protein